MKKVIFLLFLISSNVLYANPSAHIYWQDYVVGSPKETKSGNSVQLKAKQAKPTLISRLLKLDSSYLREYLLNHKQVEASYKSRPTSTDPNNAPLIDLPLPNGSYERAYLIEYSLLSPELQTRYPDIKTWKLKGVDNPSISGRLDINSFGIHGMLIMPDGDTVYIDPVKDGVPHLYQSLKKGENKESFKSDFKCDIKNGAASTLDLNLDKNSQVFHKNMSSRELVLQPALDLITYRLALAGTAEYTLRLGGRTPAYLSMVTTINRVNELYQRDLGIKLQLVSDESLLYLDAATDPYTSGNATALLSENVTNIDALIGPEHYDIGHVFDASNFGGAAYLATACTENEKAGGASGIFSPSGEVFSIEYVAHEIGHQLGATHSFNSTLGACGGGNRTVGVAVEPGSGSSVMSYSGLCGSDNLQYTTDATFHWKSIEQVYRYTRISGGTSCGVRSASNSQIPQVSPGGNTKIPANTPFLLSGSATGGSSFSWDQIDSGGVTAVDVDSGGNALIRQLLPSTQPNRYIPRLSDIFSGNTSKGESLPTTTRDLNFAFVVRNGSGGVGLSYKRVSVTDTGIAFKVLSQSTNQNLVKGQVLDIVWEVAGTNLDPINCTAVDINLLEENGVKNLLSENTDNDGAEQVTIPNGSDINDARIMVSCNDQSFFNVSSGRIKVDDDPGDTEPPVISIVGSNFLSILQGEEYQDLGAVASDNYDSNVLVVSTGVIDTSQLGRQQITYTATDSSGNTSESIRMVEVVIPSDTISPTITLIGEPLVTLVKGDIYRELGATAIDNVDSIVALTITGTVNTAIVGEYSVKYTVSDNAGNISSLIRQVSVVNPPDSIAPEITLIGDLSISLLVGDIYQESGYSVKDNQDGDNIAVTVVGAVDTSKVGRYTITYSASDSAGNRASAIRIVQVEVAPIIDTQAPEITLLGASTISIYKGSPYAEKGATVSDNIDSNLELNISGEVDGNTLGTYSIVYSASDEAGNQTTKTRIVNVIAAPVIDQLAPIITLLGGSQISVIEGSSYIEEGAIGLDNIDSNIQVTISGFVDTSTVGNYSIIYSATDAAGNTSSITRNVSVIGNNVTASTQSIVDNVDLIAPVITLVGGETITLTEGDEYSEPGYDGIDNSAGELIITVEGEVNTSVAGTYNVFYTAVDEAGNKTVLERTVIVMPKIEQISTDAPVEIESVTEVINTPESNDTPNVINIPELAVEGNVTDIKTPLGSGGGSFGFMLLFMLFLLTLFKFLFNRNIFGFSEAFIKSSKIIVK